MTSRLNLQRCRVLHLCEVLLAKERNVFLPFAVLYILWSSAVCLCISAVF